MAMRHGSRAPFILAATAVLVFMVLGLAAWRLLSQERAIAAQRLREHRENAVNLATRETERAIAQALREPYPVPLWDDSAQAPADPANSAFDDGERLELSESAPAKAIRAYRPLLASPSTRPGALLRIARCHRKLGQSAEAKAVWRQLATLGGIPVAGSPAALLALRETGEVRELRHLLESIAYPIDRATFHFFADGLPIDPLHIASSEATAQLRRLSRSAPSGVHLLTANNHYFLADWAPGVTRLAHVPSIAARVQLPHIRWQWTAPNGAVLAGSLPAETTAGLLKRASESGLPWDLRVDPPPPPAASNPVPLFALLGTLILFTLYLAHRALQHELHLAAMQSDFVAAVSHEFRTPITALTHLTELLESGGASEYRKPVYYAALSRETARLRHMVENLLDFGRIEAGRYNYRPQPIRLADVLSGLLDEFRQEPAAGGREFTLQPCSAVVQADAEALRRAVWNLLDNAAKYSPPGHPVRTEIHREGRFAAIAVIDSGPGIPSREHREIFRKFVRGAAVRNGPVKGSGIGLSMVDAIARAHGGSVRVEDNPGGGCRFTILLPYEDS
jgi:two-component system, OmpR family, phosphate regulon sensor histidine kinase PhoR